MTNEPIHKKGTTASGIRNLRPIGTVRELSERIERDPQLAEEIKKDPSGTIARIAGTPLESDPWIYYLVVVALGLTVLIAAAGSIYLASSGEAPKGRDVPQALVAIGSAAVGALAGLLAPSPARK